MKYLVAVSGGIDSVVMLDKLAKEGVHELTVAHFDHGIRSDSAADERFVKALADRYGLPFVSRREELGSSASEELARTRRYQFLGEEALMREAKIATAHHQDDAIETIAINVARGTGWRGLAVLCGERIARPLLAWSKEQVRQYALEQRLEWVEDSTNASDAYLRNRLRQSLKRQLSEEARSELLGRWQEQCKLRQQIESEIAVFTSPGIQSRYFFIQIDAIVAEELLRALVVSYVNQSPTRPQIRRALLAVKTARPGTAHLLGGVWLNFAQKTFTLSTKAP